MNKRPYEGGGGGGGHPHKKHRGNGSSYYNDRRGDDRHPQNRQYPQKHERPVNSSEKCLSHGDALARLPPSNGAGDNTDVSGYIPFTVAPGLPAAPEVTDPKLKDAPFTHRSILSTNRTIETEEHTSYERLEFLGDAYLEVIASRLIISRLGHLPAGQMSQIRELLVKNETLAEYAQSYGFDKRINAKQLKDMQNDLKPQHKAKGFTKIMGDVFEAYVAAVILSDLEYGFSTCEKWLTALWAPKLHNALEKDRFYNPNSVVHAQHGDPVKRYDPTAKQELNKRIGVGKPDIKVEYEQYAPMQELKGDQLGQNRWFIAAYLTGHGYHKKLLGKGEGKNKAEAGNWAAIEAMHGDSKDVVEECEEKWKKLKQAELEAKQKKAAAEQEELATK